MDMPKLVDYLLEPWTCFRALSDYDAKALVQKAV